MRSLTVAAKNSKTAQQLHSALAEFGAELQANEDDGYSVVVPLRGPDRQVVAVLDALQRYVAERNDGPAHVDLDGRSYTMH